MQYEEAAHVDGDGCVVGLRDLIRELGGRERCRAQAAWATAIINVADLLARCIPAGTVQSWSHSWHVWECVIVVSSRCWAPR